MHPRALAWASSLTLGLGLCAASAAQPLAQLGDSCYGCHRLSGQTMPASNAKARIPTLAGYSARQLVDVLGEFRTGERESTVMSRIVRGYSETELKAIAEQLGTETQAR